MTFVPPSNLSVTFGSSSLAQDPANLLYLLLPMPPNARLTIAANTKLHVPTVEPGY